MRRITRTLLAALLVAWAVAVLLAPAALAAEGRVLVADATGPVTPVMDAHLADAVARAERDGYEALLVRMDTPGGLVSSMREIVKTFLNADVPIVVWVTPSGAGAASAGYVIATASHVLAMAPGTNIGAATPIDMEGGEVLDKIVNDAVSYAQAVAEERGRSLEFAEEATRDGRSVASNEAVEIDVADLLAATQEELFEAIDGREVALPGDRTTRLATAGAGTDLFELSWTRRVLQALADPNLAFIFLAIAPLAIIYEFAQPGFGAGAVAGVILIILALFSLSVLPVSWAGVALLILAIALFAIEAFVPGIGVAAAGGSAALLLAGLFLFQRPTGIGVDLTVLLPTVIVVGLAAAGLAVVARRSWSAESVTGMAAMTGQAAAIERASGNTGQVMLEGAIWSVRSRNGEELEPGAQVRVVDQEGLTLVVVPEKPEEEAQ
ncbi:MAG: NfeD family protein [Nitriliruptorales bacterium]